MPPRFPTIRPPPLKRTIVTLLALAFLALAASCAATGWLIHLTQRHYAAVLHSYQARRVANLVLTHAVDAETGERGYLLTGDPGHLSVTTRSVAPLADELGRLRRLVADNPEETRRVDALEARIRVMIGNVDRIVALYNAGRKGEAVDLVRSGTEHGEMLRIRAIVAEFERDELAQLDRQRKSGALAEALTLAINIASAVLVVAVGSISVTLVARYIDKLDAARTEVDRINRGLEATVAERTSELRTANAEIGVARDRAEALLHEVNHRVANSLQLVSGFVLLQAKNLTDEAAKAALEVTQSRINAVAQVHRWLYTSLDTERVELADYLSTLAAGLRQALALESRAIRLRVDAEPLHAPPDKAVPLGVIMTELLTNACKYAYPEGETGEIRVRLAAEGETRAVLTVEDDGCGMSEGPPKGTGLGARIIAAMAVTLGSKVEYDRSPGQGVRARLAFAVR